MAKDEDKTTESTEATKPTKSKKPKGSRFKKWATRILVTLGLLIGVGLIFNEQIKLFVVNWMSNSVLNGLTADQIAANQKKDASYDFDAVKSLDLETVARAAADSSPDAIGMMAVPSVDIHLPILKGLANNNMSIGAGTMKPDQEMGEGNYALAGHDITVKGILFSPLSGVKKGDYVYLTDLSYVYKYKVTVKKVIPMTEVQWIEDVKGKKLVTLITCELDTTTEDDRMVVQGELVSKEKATNDNIKVFKSKATVAENKDGDKKDDA